jgi:hypothetical protein
LRREQAAALTPADGEAPHHLVGDHGIVINRPPVVFSRVRCNNPPPAANRKEG